MKISNIAIVSININYNNIKGLSPFQHAWVDGLDLTSGQGIHLNGAITMGNDDTFASGHYNPSNEFPQRRLKKKDLNNLSTEDQNIAAAAAIYNKDRLQWDTDDTTDVSAIHWVGAPLPMQSDWDTIHASKQMAEAIRCVITHLIMSIHCMLQVMERMVVAVH